MDRDVCDQKMLTVAMTTIFIYLKKTVSSTCKFKINGAFCFCLCWFLNDNHCKFLNKRAYNCGPFQIFSCNMHENAQSVSGFFLSF